MENRSRPQGLAVRGRKPLQDLTSQRNNRQSSNLGPSGGLKQVKLFQSMTPFEMLFLDKHSAAFVLIIHQKGIL